MRVTIHQGETAIGTAVIEHLDPPMGVAFGGFSPTERYDRARHANTIEGAYVGDNGQSLSALANEHGRLKTAAIAIEDFDDAEIGKQVTLWFEDAADFAALFSDYDSYKAYWEAS